MILEYTVLWFENDPIYTSGLENDINEYLKNWGYNPKLIIKPDDSDLVQIMDKEDIDLILMDQNLDKGQQGDTVVRKIRNNELYTEAVLYSQDLNYKEKLSEKQLEGVFFAYRKDLLKKIKKIIDLTIKKNQDINNIRGLFIAEAIYTTSQIEEIVTKILDVSGDTLEFFTCQIMQTGFLSDEAKYEFIQRFLKFRITLVNKKIQTSTGTERAKWDSLKTNLKEMQKRLKKYRKIIELRNELAHSKRCKTKKRVLLVKGDHGDLKEKIYSEERCQGIRELFLENSKCLTEFLGLLKKMNKNHN